MGKQVVISGSRDTNIHLHHDGKQISSCTGHTDFVNAIATLNNQMLFSCSDDGNLRFWELTSSKCTRVLEVSSQVRAVAVCGRILAAGTRDGTIKLWHSSFFDATSQMDKVYKGHSNWVQSVAVSPINMTIVSGSDDGTCKVWEDGECVSTVIIGEVVRDLDLSEDGSWLIVGGGATVDPLLQQAIKPLLKLYQFNTAQQQFVEEAALEGHSGEFQVRFTHAIHLYVPCAPGTVRAVYMQKEAQWSLSASDDKTVKMWDQAGVCIRTYKGHADAVRAVVACPSEVSLCTGSWDKTVKLWETTSAQCCRTFEGHASPVRTVALASKHDILASGSFDDIKIWRIGTGECSFTLTQQAAFTRCNDKNI
jgi:WD40 repeat protein